MCRLSFNSTGHNAAGGKGTENFLFFEAEDTIIENNLGTPAPKFMGGGVFAAAGVLINDPAKVMPKMIDNNTLEAYFRNCVIRQNVGTDQLNIFGAYTEPPPTEVAGSYNLTHIKFLGLSPLVQFLQKNGSPNDAGGTNGVEVSY
jgi:hypothetical protein